MKYSKIIISLGVLLVIVTGAVLLIKNKSIPETSTLDSGQIFTHEYHNSHEDIQGTASFYKGEYFSFYYPKEYFLDEVTKTEVRIMSALPGLLYEDCYQVFEEEKRSRCSSPLSRSPNTLITFEKGNPDALWSAGHLASTGEIQLGNNLWHRYAYSGEFGGTVKYYLFLEGGIITAYYNHQDASGGIGFQSVQSETYLLDRDQQQLVTENILRSLVVNKL